MLTEDEKRRSMLTYADVCSQVMNGLALPKEADDILATRNMKTTTNTKPSDSEIRALECTVVANEDHVSSFLLKSPPHGECHYVSHQHAQNQHFENLLLASEHVTLRVSMSRY